MSILSESIPIESRMDDNVCLLSPVIQKQISTNPAGADPEILKGGGTLQISLSKGGGSTIQILVSSKGLF